MSKEFRMLVVGEGVTEADLVRGKEIVLSYRISPRISDLLKVDCTGKIKLVVDSVKPNKFFGEVRDIRVFAPKLGLILSGGYTVSSAKGWLFGSEAPREHLH